MDNKTPKSETKATRQAKRWWIKERCNPQLGTYYIACGQMSKTEARKQENALYGENRMLSFTSEEEYQRAWNTLRVK